MLNQIVPPGTVGRDVGQQLPHHVQLMVPGKDQRLLSDGLHGAVWELLFLLFHLQMEELLQDVHHAVLLKDLFPEVGRGVAVRVRGIALAAVLPGPVGALVEGQEPGILPGQLGGHPDLGVIHAEKAQDALVELKAEFPWVTVIHPLPLGVLHGLPRVLVFQLKGENRDAVDGQHHVHGFLRVGGVVPLAVALDLVPGIPLSGGLVEAGLGHEVADVEGDAPVLEPVAEDGEEPVHFTGGVKGDAELPHGVDLVLLLEAGPLLGLGGLDKADQGADVEAQIGIICICPLGVAASGREKGGFDVGFKAFFSDFHSDTPHLRQSTVSPLVFSFQSSRNQCL